jgi:hypothetical protein
VRWCHLAWARDVRRAQEAVTTLQSEGAVKAMLAGKVGELECQLDELRHSAQVAVAAAQSEEAEQQHALQWELQEVRNTLLGMEESVASERAAVAAAEERTAAAEARAVAAEATAAAATTAAAEVCRDDPVWYADEGNTTSSAFHSLCAPPHARSEPGSAG